MHTHTIPLAYTILAQRIIADAAQGTRWLATGKVYLSTVPGVDLTDADCTQMLDELRRCGALRFARADYTQGMDAELLQASTWRLAGAEFHFLVVA